MKLGLLSSPQCRNNLYRPEETLSQADTDTADLIASVSPEVFVHEHTT